MKREIKFRAWITEKQMMMLATCLKLGRDLPYTDDNNGGRVFQIQCNGATNIEYFGDGFILMQYTGLKDKNGKEIYEGDILKRTDEDMTVAYIEIKFNNGGFIVEDDFGDGDLMVLGWAMIEWESMNCEVEVVGNIYENPELLK